MASLSEVRTPAEFSVWCLQNVSDPEIPYGLSWPELFGRLDPSNYYWRNYDRRLRALIDSVRPRLRVLEVGCGYGNDLHWIALQGADAVGIDVDSSQMRAAQRLNAHVAAALGRPVDVDIRRANVLNISGETFDIIYMKEVFHHLEPRDEVVSKLSELLRPGGVIILVEPNAWNPLIQIQMLKVRGFKTVVAAIDQQSGEHWVYGNERIISAGSIKRLFRQVGIEGVTELFRLLPTRLAFTEPLARIASAIERRHLDALLPPACIHATFVGRKT